MVLTKKYSFAKNRRKAKWYGSSIRYSMLVGAGNNDKNAVDCRERWGRSDESVEELTRPVSNGC